MNLKEVAYFLLTKPPLDELTDDIFNIVERFRYKTLSKNQAAELLIANCEEELNNIIEMNEQLASEVII